MADILVAASLEPSAIVARILAGHDLHFAQNMEEAEACLHARAFDLVICTISFDESKMFDLLRMVKSKPQWEGIPFVGARVRSTIVRSQNAIEALAFTCRELGAAAFLNIAEFRRDPEREMRAAIDRLLA
jgi:CheY-like chemotaxis protein